MTRHVQRAAHPPSSVSRSAATFRSPNDEVVITAYSSGSRVTVTLGSRLLRRTSERGNTGGCPPGGGSSRSRITYSVAASRQDRRVGRRPQ